MRPLSNNHALEVYTDSEEAVGALLRRRLTSQGESTGVAEGAIRKIKDVAAALQTSLREQGIDRLTPKKMRQKQNNRIPVAVAAEDAAPSPPQMLWMSLGRMHCLPPRCCSCRSGRSYCCVA